jgi:hypothetical protein
MHRQWHGETHTEHEMQHGRTRQNLIVHGAGRCGPHRVYLDEWRASLANPLCVSAAAEVLVKKPSVGVRETTLQQNTCGPSSLKGSTGLAGMPTRPAGLPHPWGATSCRKAAPLPSYYM